MSDLFLSEQYIKSILPLNENIDYKLIKTHIEEAQLRFCLELLGSNYYNDLLTRYISQSLTTIEENELVPAIKRFIAYKAFSRALIAVNIKVANNGITKSTGTYFDSVDNKMNEIYALQKEYLNDGDYWYNRAKDILIKNKSSFPLWKDDTTNQIQPDASDNNFNSNFGIIFY